MNETHCFNNKFADTVLWWSGSCSYARPMFKFKEKSMWKCYSFWLVSVPVNETSSLLVLQTTLTTISAEPADQNKRERKKITERKILSPDGVFCFIFFWSGTLSRRTNCMDDGVRKKKNPVNGILGELKNVMLPKSVDPPFRWRWISQVERPKWFPGSI